MHDRLWVRSITSPLNQSSIAFHRSLGFEPLRGDVTIDGVPVRPDYAGELGTDWRSGGRRSLATRRGMVLPSRKSVLVSRKEGAGGRLS